MMRKNGVTTFRIDDEEYFNPDHPSDDKKLVLAIRNRLNESWIWVGWNSKLYDIPFLNARLAVHGEKPVEKRMHLDLMYYARGQFMRLHSSRLDAVAKTFELKDQKTDILPSTWLRAGEGDRQAINYVAQHCKQDVRVLRDAFEILAPFVRNVHY